MQLRKHARIAFLGVSLAAACCAQAPVISSFNPPLSAVGLPVYVAGTNFTGATSVTFDGKKAPFLVDSPELIVALVPLGASTGLVKVSTPAGSATSSQPYDIVSTFWNAVQNFSLASNPAGAWTYGYEPTPGGTFTADTVVGNLFTDCSGWYDGQGFPNGPIVALNSSLYSHQYLTVIVPNDMLYLGAQTDAAVVRWTAPVSGRYWIFGQFQGLDLDLPNVSVDVYQDGTTSLFSGSLTSFGFYLDFDLSGLTLKAGSTIDFIVYSTDASYDNVGLTATIDRIE
jgi:hypothetical protein